VEARGPVGSFRRSLREEASTRWGVAPTLAEALFVLPFVGAVLVVASRADKSLFRAIADEDRLLEWLQFVGFAAASLFALVCAWRLRKAGRPLPALAYLLFGLGCFFIAGEEIAWGQRIIGFGTPETLEEINEQEEVTIHNINSVQNAGNAVFLLVGLYGSVGVWLIRWRLRGRSRDIVDLLVPPLFLTSAFFVIFAYKFLRATAFPESGFTITQIGEWPELCLAFGFSAFAFLQWLRLSEWRRVTSVQDPTPKMRITT
jgi:hypothetical protein